MINCLIELSIKPENSDFAYRFLFLYIQLDQFWPLCMSMSYHCDQDSKSVPNLQKLALVPTQPLSLVPVMLEKLKGQPSQTRVGVKLSRCHCKKHFQKPAWRMECGRSKVTFLGLQCPLFPKPDLKERQLGGQGSQKKGRHPVSVP